MFYSFATVFQKEPLVQLQLFSIPYLLIKSRYFQNQTLCSVEGRSELDFYEVLEQQEKYRILLPKSVLVKPRSTGHILRSNEPSSI